MTSVDFGFSDYERRRQTEQNRSDHLLARSRLRETQSVKRWIELQGKIRGCRIQLEKSAGRVVLSDYPVSGNCLSLRREDGRTFKITYDPDLFCVAVGDREYELTVRPVDGNDTTVWVDRQTREIQKDDEIAELAIREFLSASVYA